MKSSLRQFKRVGLACVALGSIAGTQQALAAGTDAGTDINNLATVNYQVGGVAQTPIESSPTGNSNAGVGNGTATYFEVDRKVNLVLTRVGTAQTTVSAGQVNAYVVFRLDNIGNAPQGYELTAANVAAGSDFPMSGTEVRVSADTTCAIGSTTPPAGGYVAGTDTAQSLPSVAEDACRWVYVVASTPLTAANGDLSNVSLQARTTVNNDTATPVLETAGAEDPTVVDVVFADAGRNGLELANGQYVVSTATLSVQKTSSVISDPFNLAVNPKAIPGATVEYTISLSNGGGADATVVSISDPLQAGTTFAAGVYNGNASDVQITTDPSGTPVTTYCVAEAGGVDSNADGCVRNGTTLSVGAPALSTIQTSNSGVAVAFRVTIDAT